MILHWRTKTPEQSILMSPVILQLPVEILSHPQRLIHVPHIKVRNNTVSCSQDKFGRPMQHDIRKKTLNSYWFWSTEEVVLNICVASNLWIFVELNWLISPQLDLPVLWNPHSDTICDVNLCALVRTSRYNWHLWPGTVRPISFHACSLQLMTTISERQLIT